MKNKKIFKYFKNISHRAILEASMNNLWTHLLIFSSSYPHSMECFKRT